MFSFEKQKDVFCFLGELYKAGDVFYFFFDNIRFSAEIHDVCLHGKLVLLHQIYQSLPRKVSIWWTTFH